MAKYYINNKLDLPKGKQMDDIFTTPSRIAIEFICDSCQNDDIATARLMNYGKDDQYWETKHDDQKFEIYWKEDFDGKLLPHATECKKCGSKDIKTGRESCWNR